jgi:hypothetical protein
MFRVLVAIVLVCAALEMSGCTGSLRLGSSVHAVHITSTVFD